MEIVVGIVAVIGLFLPRLLPIVAEVIEIVRKRRVKKFRCASELDALAIYLRSLGGVPADQGFEWVFRGESEGRSPSRGHGGGAPEIRGKRRGFVTVEGDSEPWFVDLAVEVDPLLDLEIRRPRFSKRLRVAAVDQHVQELDPEQPDIRFDVRRAKDERGEIVDRLFSHAGESLTDPLAGLLYRLGADAILAKNGRLGCSFKVHELLLERVREVLAALEAVAAAYSRRPEVVGLVERYLWLEGSSPRCPFCHVDIAEGEPDLTACGRCRTVHHEACFAEHGGCTLLGCGGIERALAPSRPPGSQPLT
jgi:hypothetical protein